MSVQGPKSRSVLSKLFNEAQFKDEAFPFSTHQILVMDGVPIRVMRMSFVGEMGWELHVPKEYCLSIYEKIMKVGEEFEIQNAGYRAIDSLSIEKGIPNKYFNARQFFNNQ